MSKSAYEMYAREKQPELLNMTCSLRLCIAWLQGNRAIFSEDYIEAQIDLVASIFGLTSGEIKRVIEGEEYWCL